MAYAKIKPRRGSLYEWSTLDPILEEGEMVIEAPDDGIGTGPCRFKLGDGTSKYSELAYAFDGASASEIVGGNVTASNTISIRSGTTEEWNLVDPVLEENEITYDSTVNSFKVGNGIDTWSALSYTSGGSSVEGIDDYGDEDAEESAASEASLMDILHGYPIPATEEDDNVAHLADLLNT